MRAQGHSPPANLAHTQAFWGAMEAFIQMAVSLGSGFTQELLLLVRKDCMDSLSSPLSLCSSATIPPPLVPLKQHPRFSSYPNSLLLLLHHSRISSYFHLFVASVSMDSANQTEDGQITATSVGMGWGQSRQGYYNTQTHTHKLCISILPIPAFNASVTAIYWLAGFYYINNNLPLKSV